MSKRDVRLKLRQMAPTEDERRRQALLACDAIMRWPVFREAKVVASYVPLHSEFDVGEVNKLILAAGKTWLLPRILQGEGEMDFCIVDAYEMLEKGAYGILQPCGEAKPVSPDCIDLMLVPAEAVSPLGQRLGKGGGYYDRFLQKKQITTLAPVMTDRFFTSLPEEEHDVRMKYYLLDGKIYKV